MLYGRDGEQRVLAALLDRSAAGRGGALVLRGEVGIGKSALLAAAASSARDRGMRVLTTNELRRLSGDGAERAQPHRAAMAALDHLTSDPAAPPALVLVDDAQWLDRPTWEALTFLGRRLDADPVLLLVAMRDGAKAERRLAGAGLPELAIGPLPAPDAAALLDHVAPGLTGAAREQVLAGAAGYPLALVELGSAAARYGPDAPLPAWMPLSTRVERLFGALVAELPVPTRTVLLVAALDDGDRLDEILAAGSALGDRVTPAGPVTPGDVEPAVAAGLVAVDEGFRLRFRHPLLRLALRQGASTAQRRRVHAALASVVGLDPDRRVWHRAATAAGPDEAMARELTEAAARMRPRNADAARAALERAAELTADPRLRASRLLAAREATDPQDAAPAGAAALAGIDTLRREGDASQALDLLLVLAIRSYWSTVDPEAVAATADSLEVPARDARLLCVLAAVQPVERGAAILRTLRELNRGIDSSPRELSLLGSAATGIGAFDLAARFFGAAAVGLRAEGRLGTLVWALTGQAWTAAQVGDARRAVAVATEARTATVDDQPLRTAAVDLALAQAEALRGNGSAAHELAGGAEEVLLAAGAFAMLPAVDLVRGIAELASGRAAEAFDHLARIFDPVRAGNHPQVRFSALGHLAEAAVHCGRLRELEGFVRDLEPVARSSGAPVLAVTLGYARAVLAPDRAAAGAFTAALAADLSEWPFERARLQLAYGTWLRRRRRTGESRPLLRGAAVVFDALGATAWAERARGELRATGESPRRPVDGRDRLTAQEVQVARLAAEGLSNREIAERLFLSPRTVTTHLSRIFPKLGITSRRQLPGVLGP